MFNIKNIILGSIITTGMVFYACSGNSNPEPTDTPTSGEVNVVVDESFQKLFDNQIYTFESIYKNAQIHVKYLPENEALSLMINDSCKVVTMCRDLTEQERKSFEAKNLFPISTKIAEDAIVLLVNPENNDTTLTVDQVKYILLGNDSLWSQLNKQSELGGIKVVLLSTKVILLVLFGINWVLFSTGVIMVVLIGI